VFKNVQEENDSVFDRLKSTVTVSNPGDDSGSEPRSEPDTGDVVRVKEEIPDRPEQNVHMLPGTEDIETVWLNSRWVYSSKIIIY
jgi:hypothetical protein